ANARDVARLLRQLTVVDASLRPSFLERPDGEVWRIARDEHGRRGTRVESERNRSKADEGARHEAGPDQQDDGKGELDGDEKSASPIHTDGIALQTCSNPRPRRLPRRYEADHDGTHQRERHGKERHPTVERNGLATRQ